MTEETCQFSTKCCLAYRIKHGFVYPTPLSVFFYHFSRRYPIRRGTSYKRQVQYSLSYILGSQALVQGTRVRKANETNPAYFPRNQVPLRRENLMFLHDHLSSPDLASNDSRVDASLLISSRLLSPRTKATWYEIDCGYIAPTLFLQDLLRLYPSERRRRVWASPYISTVVSGFRFRGGDWWKGLVWG